MAILLVRHAETDSNAARVIQVPEAPLSERGRAQATRLAERLTSVGVARILSSDLMRAQMTAEHVHAATGVAIELEPLLQERNFGALRGRSYDDVGIDIFAEGYSPPEGESWEEFHARVDRAWEQIRAGAAATRGNLAVITHGLVCRSIAARLVALPEGQPEPEVWPNTSLSIVDEAPPHAVRLLNCARHLDGILEIEGAQA